MEPRFGLDFREDLAALLAWRRDVRHFRSDPIDEALLLRLLTTAQSAPSVGNSQPWRFVRIRSAALRVALVRHVDARAALAGSAYRDMARHSAYAALKLHGLEEAPEVLAVFCDEETAIGLGLGAATMPETRTWSVLLAIHTLWLAARAEGIGLGWVSILQPQAVTDMLQVPSGWRFVALLCLGYPAAADDIPELERRGWQARLDATAHVCER